MRQRLILFGYFSIFFIVLQVVFRAAFLIYNYKLSSQLTTWETMQVFGQGLKMDASISGYFLMLIGLILSVSVFNSSRWLLVTLNTVVVILLLLMLTIVVVDFELYRHWGFRLNTTPLFYMGSEAMGSVELHVIVNLLLFFSILLAGGLLLYLKIFPPKIRSLVSAPKWVLLVLIVLSGLMFIPIRGSFTVAPMNTGFVYFHKSKAYANHAAINVVWNFLYSLRKGSNIEYPENFYDQNKATVYFDSLYSDNGSTIPILNHTRPNIILFILESFTADLVEPLGGLKGVAPNLNKFCEEGILFDNFYSSGDRTDKGVISILSAYPAQPQTSIIKYPAKTQRLPYLSHHLQRLGYQTSFTYGGDIDFANFRSYLTSCRFNYMTTEDDFPDEVNYSKWGVHDHLVLERAFNECDTAKAPYFKTILTLSSHEPFDVPMRSVFLKGKDEESLFLNSCHYTDSTIGVFIAKAKQKSWWKNTLVLFVADHGHRLPGVKEAKDRTRFRIPFLMMGGAISKDSVVHTFASQTDIANTILAQLDKSSEEFQFSRNILSDQAKSFAVYFFNDGYGYVAPEKYLVYDNPGKLFLKTDGTSEDMEISKAYQQVLFSDYNRK